MSTGIGACLVCLTPSLNRSLLACTLSFSAGVMIYVSLVEVIAVSSEYFAKSRSEASAAALATLSFFAGAALMALIDNCVHRALGAAAAAGDGLGDNGSASPSHSHSTPLMPPPREHTHHGDEELVGGRLRPLHPPDDHDEEAAAIYPTSRAAAIEAVGRRLAGDASRAERKRLLAMAVVISAAIALHNIPEGMATLSHAPPPTIAAPDAAPLPSPPPLRPALTPALAPPPPQPPSPPRTPALGVRRLWTRASRPCGRVTPHHPRDCTGLAVAMPVYHATGSRARAVALGSLSGMSEPFGALLASLVANEHSSTGAFGGMFGLTAGMMTYVCLSELLPSAYAERGVPRSRVVAAFFAGAAVMASSLIIEKFASAAFSGPSGPGGEAAT
ncbi:hypothetical protein EMIHUDRAFT_436011 [Emiliania huxleyi CCMP1516]|uniref:Zinc transporter n=2 Tax=Emiliania huxleyi TaxID=2903 RepID=A0A0D3J997_EMIH1|nr:hypothetical protein EMIHUDRAFT_436011 [Emiliania huxleyi CCMP1516]EOD20082.1 hypothetical protein EMIHUDRAFT_436011 [Emiliania huxleyi CCMP1516]|eukprot:XP_005772511.1 hypothetical protein EMIHUDRAFT_436011 [Emiliania huxleyi CCMP1516]